MRGCSKRGARSAFAHALYSLTPSATALREQLLARGVTLQPPGGPPGEGAGDAERALMPSPAMSAAQQPAAFPASLSCPPEFWGEALATHPFWAQTATHGCASIRAAAQLKPCAVECKAQSHSACCVVCCILWSPAQVLGIIPCTDICPRSHSRDLMPGCSRLLQAARAQAATL